MPSVSNAAEVLESPRLMSKTEIGNAAEENADVPPVIACGAAGFVLR